MIAPLLDASPAAPAVAWRERARNTALAHLSCGGTCDEFVAAAALARFPAVAIRICPRRPGEQHVADILGDDAAVRELRSRADAAGVRLATINGYQMYPEVDRVDLERVIDAAVVLGASTILTAGFDADMARFEPRFARFCESAARAGLRIGLEFMPYTAIRSLGDALGVVERTGAASAGVVVDALHLERSGGTPGDVGGMPVARLAYVQLCDAPLTSPRDLEGLIDEARTGRLPLGAGGLPLARLAHVVPSGAMFEYEVARADMSDRSVTERALAARADVDRFFAGMETAPRR